MAKLILNRANKANALNYDFIMEIGKALDVLEQDDAVGALLSPERALTSAPELMSLPLPPRMLRP